MAGPELGSPVSWADLRRDTGTGLLEIEGEIMEAVIYAGLYSMENNWSYTSQVDPQNHAEWWNVDS